MNSRQLRKLGVPEDCLRTAMIAVQEAAATWKLEGKNVQRHVEDVVAHPEAHLEDRFFGKLAGELIAESETPPLTPVEYRTWGAEGIEQAARDQMRQACMLPDAVSGALMPDAHVGYGLPIGGVLAVDNAVVPYAVGVDIACRMKLSVLDTPVAALDEKFPLFKEALEKGTRFGVGSAWPKRKYHPVLDEDWAVSRITRENKDKAWSQLGTSGSGNHFVEFGVLHVPERLNELDLNPGDYVALLSHSGSRGTGASVCSTYSAIARSRLPKKYAELGQLAWLDMESQEGQEYWKAMNLMGDYAAANHAVIHRDMAKLLGAHVIAGVENHHNFAWLERHGGRDVYVHRKGATPAGKGVLGVIPGSMKDPAFVVRGKGEPTSLDSASHGAGRCMSRKHALNKYRFREIQRDLERQGVHVLSAGADEVPQVYKNIHEVMRQQRDLVEPIARFDPKIVKMCGDGTKAED